MRGLRRCWQEHKPALVMIRDILMYAVSYLCGGFLLHHDHVRALRVSLVLVSASSYPHFVADADHLVPGFFSSQDRVYVRSARIPTIYEMGLDLFRDQYVYFSHVTNDSCRKQHPGQQRSSRARDNAVKLLSSGSLRANGGSH